MRSPYRYALIIHVDMHSAYLPSAALSPQAGKTIPLRHQAQAAGDGLTEKLETVLPHGLIN